MPGPELRDEIAAHYEVEVDEERRITEGFAQLELVRTQEIIRRHLPTGGLRILDVGGAAGVHAAWLVADGHRVHLVDPVPDHVDQARALAAASAGSLTADVGDARQLVEHEGSFDAVLALGPLYHLTERAERLQALSEVRRVTRPGGVIFVAAISRFASLFSGLSRGFLFDPEFRSIVQRDLEDGQHRNPTPNPQWFTTAFFHHPDELRSELEDARLDVRDVLGVEGLAGWLGHLDEQWDDPDACEAILDAARATEAEPTLLGLSAHLLAVAARPA